MKNPVEMLKEIKNLLGVELSQDLTKENEVILAQLKLENGTVLESDDFVTGKEVFILTEDERVALPVGSYELEDGRTLEITEEGLINSIEVKAEEMPEEIEEEENADLDEDKYPTRDEFDALKEMVMSIKEMMGDDYMKPKDDKMEEAEELKEELSKPAANPIKHNPEAKTEKNQNLYSQKKSGNTLDRVMNKISNFK
jgi:hypothetical protein|tara:strand:- start:995 stop:1588 length:594 start_codon:yes stop_codon:yes gene_type:complete